MPITPENRHHYNTPNWRALSHYVRFVRAKGKCENCGVMHGQRRLFTEKHGPVILATAHLDQDPTDNREKNLKAYCQQCHLNHDRVENVRKIRHTFFLKRLFRQPTLLDFSDLLPRKKNEEELINH
jgi:Zn finger protein HypA/HybF involved in hydrogenase expression